MANKVPKGFRGLGAMRSGKWDESWELLPQRQKQRWTKKTRQLRKHTVYRIKKLNRPVKIEPITGKDLYDLIVRQYNNCCAYCGVSFDETELTMDHKIPISKGGGHLLINLLPSCQPCNGEKRNKIA